MAAAAAAAGAEITQPVAVVEQVEQAAPEQLLRALLLKLVALVERENHRAFLELLFFMRLVEAVALMVLQTAMPVFLLHCHLAQQVSGGRLQSVEMADKKPPLVALMDMEIAVTAPAEP